MKRDERDDVDVDSLARMAGISREKATYFLPAAKKRQAETGESIADAMTNVAKEDTPKPSGGRIGPGGAFTK